MTATAGDDAYLTVDGVSRDVPQWPVSSELIDESNDLRALADDGWCRNEIAVRMEPPPVWQAYTVPLNFTSPGVTGMLYDFEPWRAPNRNPMPRILPFPRLARAECRVRAALQRLADAAGVLRHGLPETDW